MTSDCKRGNLVELVLCVLLGHPNTKIANSMKLVTFAFFSSQYNVFELTGLRRLTYNCAHLWSTKEKKEENIWRRKIFFAEGTINGGGKGG